VVRISGPDGNCMGFMRWTVREGDGMTPATDAVR
jgi:hypothetical protein